MKKPIQFSENKLKKNLVLMTSFHSCENLRLVIIVKIGLRIGLKSG
jgi:hypothetical protein